MGWERGGSPEHINMILARVFDDLAQRYERLINEKNFKKGIDRDARPGVSRADHHDLFSSVQLEACISEERK
jgi:hypothetical protein